MPKVIDENVGEHGHHFQGGPKWHQQLLQSILKEAHSLASEGYHKYGAWSPEQKERAANLKAKYQQLQGLQKENGSLSFSVKPDLEPVYLFAKDLGLIRRNNDFAKQVLYDATGEIPDEKDIEELKNRVDAQFPNLNELQASELQQAQLAKKAFNPTYTPDLQKKHAQLKKWESKQTKSKDSYLDDFILEHINTLKQKEPNHSFFQKPLETQKKLIVDRYTSSAAEPAEKEWWENANESSKINYNIFQNIKLDNIKQKKNQIKEIEDALKRKNWDETYNLSDKQRSQQFEIQRELKKLESQSERIAPLNKTHKRVSEHIKKGINDDTIDVSNEEIKAAKKGSISDSLKPYLKKAEDISGNNVARYKNSYQKNVIDALRDETRENLLEEILPNINLSFGAKGMGSFHSGARAEALKSAVQKKEKDLKREIAKLLHAGEIEAQKQSHIDKDRYLQAGQLESGAIKAEKDAARSNAELYRLNAVSKKNMHHLDLGALSHEASLEQKQKQAEIDTKLAMFKEEKDHPITQLEREAMLVRGLPVQQRTFTSQSMGQPVPPNPYNVAGGILGQIAGNAQQHAKGGSVRGHYARGGTIDKWREIGESVQPNEYDKEAAKIAKEFRNYKGSPHTNWLSHVGTAMLSNVRGDPLDNLGKGNATYMEAKERDHERSLTSKEKAANLYNKMSDSRLRQHEVIAAYQNKLAELAETSRHYKAAESVAERELDKKKEDSVIKAHKAMTELNPKTGEPYTWIEKAEMKAQLNHNSPSAQNAAQKLVDSQKSIFSRTWENIAGKSAPKKESKVSQLSDADLDARLAQYG